MFNLFFYYDKILLGGNMASEYAYRYSVIDIEYVMKDIDEYIIPENQAACKLLWSKNIFTIMSNNYENEHGDCDFSWIALGDLSEENQELFDRLLTEKDPRVAIFRTKKIIKLPTAPRKGVDTFEAFKEIIDLFSYQDVQKQGYMTIEEFMIRHTNCRKTELNPEHLKAVKPNLSDFNGDVIAYSRAFDEYVQYESAPSEIVSFDETKMIKSFKEYVDDSMYAGLYDPEEGKVFLNKIYYDAHMRYKREFGQQNFKKV